MKLVIKRARIIDPTQGIDQIGDLLVEDGIILGIERNIELSDAKVINAENKWIMPGIVDIHVHLRDPGQEWKEDIETGTKAALFGGVLRVACMPNTSPVNDSPEVTSYIIKKAKEKGYVKVYPIAAITKGQKGKELTEFGRLIAAGAVGFSDDGKWVENSEIMRRALLYASQLNAPIISHPEDPTISEGGQINLGKLSAKLGLKGIPSSAEAIAVARDLILCKETKGKLHLAHISAKDSVKLLYWAKEEGIPFTAETCPHYFLLTEEEVDNYNTLAKVNPPLRTKEDVLAIKEALKDGIIEVIASDHAPHSVLEKNVEFELASPGMIGVQFLLSFSLCLVKEGYLTPLKLAEYLTLNPSKVIGISPPSLKPGEKAEFVLINPEKEFVITEEIIKSKSKNTPFLGKTFTGAVEKVFVKSKVFEVFFQ